MKAIKLGTNFGDINLVDIPNTLEALQEAVGGYIEVKSIPSLVQFNILLIVNEEGLLKQLPPNENLYPFFYVGNVLVVGEDGDEFTDLTDKQVQIFEKWRASL